jgi:hypothetical protein
MKLPIPLLLYLVFAGTLRPCGLDRLRDAPAVEGLGATRGDDEKGQNEAIEHLQQGKGRDPFWTGITARMPIGGQRSRE